MADAASVEDHSVREDGEFLLREQGGDVVLGLDRVGLLGPAEATGQAPRVRVDSQARGHEDGAQNDVRDLASDASELNESGHIVANNTVVRLDVIIGERYAFAFCG